MIAFSFAALPLCVVSIFLLPQTSLALNADQIEKCKTISGQEIIKAATSDLIYIGRRNFESGIPDSENPFPFTSFEEFIKRYPDCCQISNKFVGDYDAKIRKHFDGGTAFPAYFVSINVRFATSGNSKYSRKSYHATALVTCFGQAVNESQLIDMGD